MTSLNKFPKILLALAAVLALAGVGLLGYLSFAVGAGGGLAGCGGEIFDCDAVLATSWSRWMGVPVSWLGLGCYALMAVGALVACLGKGFGWQLLEATCLLAVGTGLWFVAIQFITLDSFCLYCLLTHLCGLLASLLIVWARFVSDDYQQGPTRMIGVPTQSAVGSTAKATHSMGPPPIGIPTLLASLAIVAFIGGQLFSKEETSKRVDVANLSDAISFEEFSIDQTAPNLTDSEDEPQEELAVDLEKNDASKTTVTKNKQLSSNHLAPIRKRNGSRKVTLLKGRLTLDTYAYPLLGSPEAEHVVVEIMDYTCPHCRKFHKLLSKAVKEYNGKVAIIVLHSPSELLCNPYIKTSRPQNRGACRAAKLAIGVSMVDPTAFPAIHEWLLKGDKLPSYTSGLVEAKKLVDNQKLRLTLQDNSGALSARVTRNIKLYASMQSKAKLVLPMQIVGDQAYSGKPESLEVLYEQWEESLGIAPPSVDLPF